MCGKYVFVGGTVEYRPLNERSEDAGCPLITMTS